MKAMKANIHLCEMFKPKTIHKITSYLYQEYFYLKKIILLSKYKYRILI